MGKALFAVVLLLFCCVDVLAGSVQVQGVRIWAAPDHTRVVFDLSAPISHKVFTLRNPDRVVIDLKDARLNTSLRKLDKKGLLKRIRSGTRNGNDLRLVLDVKQRVRPKSFFLTPNASYGHRLVVDLHDIKQRKSAPPKTRSVAPGAPRDLVIAIDAGHGGEDPGARGPRGPREKVVVLAIARKLAAFIEKEPGMRPVLIREGDYYVGLRTRARKARKHHADLLISIHADAFKDPGVYGSSVYVVSRKGASNEMARWLAERENASDLAGGVSLDDKTGLLKTVLLDLSQSASMETGNEVAVKVLRELRRIGKAHKKTVQHAGFMVLKAPDIPSILIETAFISNPAEERRLRDPHHQQKVAGAIFKGLRSYYVEKAVPGTLWAGTRHVIKTGETLSGIAMQYRVSAKKIRVANGMAGDRLQAGKVLRIPSAVGG
ncbi:MAG: N-acetylmuramoyl-L-alanine amidase [Gammaproteobacteria bacterium]